MKRLLQILLIIGAATNCFAQAPNIFITEYFEANTNQQAIEIINASNSPVDISKIRIATFYNGATTFSSSKATVADDGVTTQIASGDIFVFYNSLGISADNLPATVASKRVGLSSGGGHGYNGNDAVTIEYNTTGITWVGLI